MLIQTLLERLNFKFIVMGIRGWGWGGNRLLFLLAGRKKMMGRGRGDGGDDLCPADPDLVVTVEELVGSVVAGGEPGVVDKGQTLRGQGLGKLHRRLHVVVVTRPPGE